MLRLLLVLGIYGSGAILGMCNVAFAAGLFLWNNIFQPLEFARYPAVFPAAQYVFAVLVLSVAFHAWRGDLNGRWNVFMTTTAMMLVWAAISAVASPYQESFDGFMKLLKYLGPLLLISYAVRSERDTEAVAAVLMLSVGIWSSQGGVKGLVSGVTNKMMIPGGQMYDNNDFMVGTVGAIPMICYFAFGYDWKYKRAVRILACVILFLSLTCIVFSNSRGAAVGLAGLLLLYILLLSKAKIRDGLLLAAALVTAFQLLPDSFFERMSTIEVGAEQTEASAQSRSALMLAALEGTLDNPIFGLGPDCWLIGYDRYIDDRHDPHCMWLKCSVEIGLVGFALYLLVIAATSFQIMRARNLARRLGDKRASAFAVACQGSIFGICCAGTFTSHPYLEYFFAFMAVGAGFSQRYLETHAPAEDAPRPGQARARRAARGARARTPSADAAPGGAAGQPAS